MSLFLKSGIFLIFLKRDYDNPLWRTTFIWTYNLTITQILSVRLIYFFLEQTSNNFRVFWEKQNNCSLCQIVSKRIRSCLSTVKLLVLQPGYNQLTKSKTKSNETFWHSLSAKVYPSCKTKSLKVHNRLWKRFDTVWNRLQLFYFFLKNSKTIWRQVKKELN